MLTSPPELTPLEQEVLEEYERLAENMKKVRFTHSLIQPTIHSHILSPSHLPILPPIPPSMSLTHPSKQPPNLPLTTYIT
jgi:hypothetical protein